MLSFVTRLTLAVCLIATTSADVFTAKTSLPGNTFDGQPINAVGEAFFIGGSPVTYCPADVNPNCPNVTGTVLAAGFTQLNVRDIIFLMSGFLMLGADHLHRLRFLVASKSTSQPTEHWDSLKHILLWFHLARTLADSSTSPLFRTALLHGP
jgi:hypothetical protein